MANAMARQLDRDRPHRLALLGNGVVPKQAEFAIRMLWPQVFGT
jgi:hypothetical protein